MKLREYQNDIVQSVRNSYKHGKKAPCIVLPCGGGKSVIVAEMAKKTTENGKRVLFIVHRKELCDQIRNTFSRWGVDMNLCQIGMVQTVCRHLDKVPAPSLIITDENHHAKADSYMKIYKAFPKAYRIGVTATPERLDGSGLKDVNDDLIEGVSAKWLIENKYLSPYEYYAPKLFDIESEDVDETGGDYNGDDVGKKMITKRVFGDVIGHYRQLADGKQTICYCPSIEMSKAMMENFNENGITAAHIDGETPKLARDMLIERFRQGKIKVLCNVDLISEGFDVPDCECAILLRPTKSLTLYIQQSMRCMRYKDGKTAVIIDHVGNYSKFGLPDNDRKWSLEGKKKEKITPMLTCEYCYDVFHKFRKDENGKKLYNIICPHCKKPISVKCSNKACGKEFAKYRNENGDLTEFCPFCNTAVPKDKREGKTEYLQSYELQKITEFKVEYDDPRYCNSYEELLALAKKKGYKSGWAWHQAKARGFIT